MAADGWREGRMDGWADRRMGRPVRTIAYREPAATRRVAQLSPQPVGPAGILAVT